MRHLVLRPMEIDYLHANESRVKSSRPIQSRGDQDHVCISHQGEPSMPKLSRRGLAALAAAFAVALAGFFANPAQAQNKPIIKVSSLTLPVFNPLVWNIMKAKG